MDERQQHAASEVRAALLRHYSELYTANLKTRMDSLTSHPGADVEAQLQQQAQRLAVGKVSAIMRQYAGREAEALQRLLLYQESSMTWRHIEELSGIELVRRMSTPLAKRNRDGDGDGDGDGEIGDDDDNGDDDDSGGGNGDEDDDEQQTGAQRVWWNQ